MRERRKNKGPLVACCGWLVVREEEESVVVGHVKSKYTL